MAIEIKDVSYTYMPGMPFERQALRQVSLTIKKDSFTAIAGHTGSGKSTLVQHFNGLLAPTQGQVLVDGVDINDKSKANRKQAKAARQSVGMVFQYPEQQLFEETVAADIAFGPKNQGLTGEALQDRVREAMHFVHLAPDLAERSPFQLSGGQMRRVAIAGVLALNPKYLVLDEPTAGLDPRGREQLIANIQELHAQKGVTIIFISHNMDDIARLADTLVVMAQGEKVAAGTPRDVFQQTELLSQAGLQPPEAMQLLAVLRARGLKVDPTAMTVPEAVQAIQRALTERGRRHAE